MRIEPVTPASVRPVDPPMRVWIDMRKLLPRGPHEDYATVADGLVTEYEMPALLTEWAWRTDGSVLGRVTYVLGTADKQWSTTLTHYVPVHLLRPWSRRQHEFHLR